MRRIFALVPAMIVIIFLSWSAENKGMARSQSMYAVSTADTVRDSIIFYETDIKTKQKSYMKELQGKWNVISMRRQQKAELENLNNISIEFKDDLSFSGKAPCNSISGVYILKGTSIKFSNTIATRMACDNLEQESAFLKLLEATVSAYSVSETKLLLRDGSSNIVFELERSSQ